MIVVGFRLFLPSSFTPPFTLYTGTHAEAPSPCSTPIPDEILSAGTNGIFLLSSDAAAAAVNADVEVGCGGVLLCQLVVLHPGGHVPHCHGGSGDDGSEG